MPIWLKIVLSVAILAAAFGVGWLFGHFWGPWGIIPSFVFGFLVGGFGLSKVMLA